MGQSTWFKVKKESNHEAQKLRNRGIRQYKGRPSQPRAPPRYHKYHNNNNHHNPRKPRPYFPRKQFTERAPWMDQQRTNRGPRRGGQPAAAGLQAVGGWQLGYPWATQWQQPTPQLAAAPTQHWGNWSGLGWAPAGFYQGF